MSRKRYASNLYEVARQKEQEQRLENASKPNKKPPSDTTKAIKRVFLVIKVMLLV